MSIKKSKKEINKELFENGKNHMKEDIKIENEIADKMLNYFDKVAKDTEDKIHAIYSRFATDNKMTIAEAKKYISESEFKAFRMSLKDYLKEIEKEGADSKTLKELDILSAKARLSRQEKLLADIYASYTELAVKTNKAMEKEFKEVVQNSFIRSSFDIQKAIGVSFAVDNLSDRAIDLIVKHKWAKKTFSQSIWGHVDTLNEKIRETLAKGFMSGASVQKMTMELQKRTGVARDVVERLVQNQCQYFSNEGERQGYIANGIKEYVYLGTVEKGFACDCASLNGVIIKIEDAEPLVNFPPLHPHCICGTRAHFDNAILDGKDVKPFDKNMTMEEWKEAYLKDCPSLKCKTKDGIMDIYITKHSEIRNKQRGFLIADVIDAVENPLEVKKIRYDEDGRPSQRYIGRKVTVNINPENHNFTTGWKTSEKIRKKLEKKGVK